MVPPRSSRFRVGALGWALAVVLGGAAWSAVTLQARQRAVAEQANRQVAERERLQAANARLRAENEIPAPLARAREPQPVVKERPPEPMAVSRPLAMQALADLKRERVIYFAGVMLAAMGKTPGDLGPFRLDRAGQLSPSFAEFYGLPSHAFDRLQGVLSATRQRCQELALANAMVTRDASGMVTLTIPASGEAPALRAQLHAAWIQTLGVEMAAAHETLEPRGFESIFQAIGGAGWTVTVKPAPNAPGRYALEHRGGPGYSTSGIDRATLERRLGALAPLLPADL